MIAVGVAARCTRFVLSFPLWEDECFLAVNLLGRSYGDLLQPLAYHQVAPPVFLWLQKATVDVLGFSEWMLRLGPFTAGLASLFLFDRFARLVLTAPERLAAVAVFAVAYPGIRYSAEAKPYAFDLLVAIVLLTLLAGWWQDRRSAWVWALCACAPIAMSLSFPAAFVGGGVSLVLGCAAAAPLVRSWPTDVATLGVRGTCGAGIRRLLPWLCLSLVLAASLAGTLLLSARQQAAEMAFMSEFWSRAFPPWRQPWLLPGWLASIHAGELLAWPVGGARGASTATLMLTLIGVAVLARQRRWFLLGACATPAALSLAAAIMGRYPYGGHVKFSMHLGAAVCVLAGVGAASAAASLSTRSARRGSGRGLSVFLAGMLMIGVGSSVRDIVFPYKTRSDERARSFARWFWPEAAEDGPVFDIERDLGRILAPDSHRELSWAAMFVCNRAIYDPGYKAAAGTSVGADGVPVGLTGTFRGVTYEDQRFPPDEAALALWLGAMERHYAPLGRESFAMTRYDKRDRRIVRRDRIRVYRFGPQTP